MRDGNHKGCPYEAAGLHRLRMSGMVILSELSTGLRCRRSDRSGIPTLRSE